MAGLIVIQIVPETPVDALTFRRSLTDLQVQVFDLSFTTVDSDPPGANRRKRLVYRRLRWLGEGVWPKYQLPSAPPSDLLIPVRPQPAASFSRSTSFREPVPGTGNFHLESVAIAVIEVTSAATSGNFRVEIQQVCSTQATAPPSDAIASTVRGEDLPRTVSCSTGPAALGQPREPRAPPAAGYHRLDRAPP